MTAEILHMLNKGGSDFPAIGTDFDGFGEMEVMEIGHPDEMEKLWEILKQKGVKESQLDKIWYRNAMRVLKKYLNIKQVRFAPALFNRIVCIYF